MITGGVIGFIVFSVLWILGCLIASSTGRRLRPNGTTFVSFIVFIGLGVSIGYLFQ